MKKDTYTTQVIQLAREQGMLRPRDLIARHIPHVYLQRLYERGEMIRSGRGIYMLTETNYTEHFSYAEACKRVPNGVVCLLSALRFHNLGTQSPFQIWLAIHPKAYLPRVDYPPLRIVRFSGAVQTEGIEEHVAPEGKCRVYNVPKTVVDCFRYRNKVGMDVALEALHECWNDKRATADELYYYAAVDKVSTIMQPYLEALA